MLPKFSRMARGVKAVGITAGASAPDVLVKEVVAKLVSTVVIFEELQGREKRGFRYKSYG